MVPSNSGTLNIGGKFHPQIGAILNSELVVILRKVLETLGNFRKRALTSEVPFVFSRYHNLFWTHR